MTAAILLGLIALCLAIGVPIGISVGISTTVVMATMSDIPLVIINQNAFSALDSFPLLAVPLFMLSGTLMSYGGISKRLVQLADQLIGFVAGGLAMVTVLACMFFSAISGSAVATVSGIGCFMIPEMKKKNYDVPFAAALTAAAGTIGVIIPPSISFVVYGVMTGVSIGDLFIAGIIPGTIIGIGLMLVSYFMSKKRNYPCSDTRPTVKSVLHALKESFWAILVPVIILGGIYGGVFTPTEAAGVAVVYSLAIGKFVYRELDRKTTYKAFQEAVLVNGAVTFMMGLSMAFARYLTMEGIPGRITEAILGISDNGVILILVINAFLLIVGCFIDNISAAVILTPILLPVVEGFGMDPIHFGIVISVALAIGFVTPPYGPTLFVSSAISGVKMEAISRAVFPFFLSMVVSLLLITYVPVLSTGLVHLAAR